ncbi:MAG: hypothetical protein K2X11_01400 [Acetobacteraceae bacterium]|nr:hypothetical protein [Acetobacteraceae bacterium]
MEIGIPLDLLQAEFEDTCLRLKNVLTTGRCTLALAVEISVSEIARQYNKFSIIEEIAILEGSSSRESVTKQAERLKRIPIKNIWHKHHFQARFIPKNLSKDKFVEEALTRAFTRFDLDDPIPRQILDHAAYEMVIGTFERLQSRRALTGEWIIFQRENGKNEYITLGTHGENMDLLINRINSHQASGTWPRKDNDDRWQIPQIAIRADE